MNVVRRSSCDILFKLIYILFLSFSYFLNVWFPGGDRQIKDVYFECAKQTTLYSESRNDEVF